MRTVYDVKMAVSLDTMLDVGRLAVQQRQERDRLERDRLEKIKAAEERKARRNDWKSLFPAVKGV